MLEPELLRAILSQYRLNPEGIHGIGHWARVLENGLRLADDTGAKVEIVELFAVLHDCRRQNDGFSPFHGRWAAKYAATLRGSLLHLNDEDFHLLYTACADHTRGKREGDITLQTCWDADRLDLGRVGITPMPNRLCTLAARQPEILAWAESRSQKREVPEWAAREWKMR
jgi:uncharacterized protein